MSFHFASATIDGQPQPKAGFDFASAAVERQPPRAGFDVASTAPPREGFGQKYSVGTPTKQEIPFSQRPNIIPLPIGGAGEWVAPKWLAAVGLPGSAALGEPYGLEEVQSFASLGVGGAVGSGKVAPLGNAGVSRSFASHIPGTKARTQFLAYKQAKDLAGGEENLAALYAAAIENRKSAIPDYQRNLGQAIGQLPESTSVLASMQGAARKPGLAVQAEKARDANLVAVERASRAVGGVTHQELLAQEALVAANAEKNYALGRRAKPVGSRAIDEALDTPSGRRAINMAVRAADDAHRRALIPAEAGTGLPTEFTGKALEDILKSIGEQRADLVARGKNVGVEDLNILQNRVANAIKEKNPDVVTAREHYAEDMGHLNQMKILQRYQKDLSQLGTSAVTGPENEARLVKSVTDGHYQSFDKTLTVKQRKFLERITEETRRAEIAADRAGRTGSIPDERGPLEKLSKAAMLNHPTTVAAKRGIELAGGWRNKKVAEALLGQYLNPRTFVSPLTPTITSRLTNKAMQFAQQKPPLYGFQFEDRTSAIPAGYD